MGGGGGRPARGKSRERNEGGATADLPTTRSHGGCTCAPASFQAQASAHERHDEPRLLCAPRITLSTALAHAPEYACAVPGRAPTAPGRARGVELALHAAPVTARAIQVRPRSPATSCSPRGSGVCMCPCKLKRRRCTSSTSPILLRHSPPRQSRNRRCSLLARSRKQGCPR